MLSHKYKSVCVCVWGGGGGGGGGLYTIKQSVYCLGLNMTLIIYRHNKKINNFGNTVRKIKQLLIDSYIATTMIKRVSYS